MHEVIPGARVEGTVLLNDRDLYARMSTRSPSGAPWAWSSSDRTLSRPCRSTTTWRPDCGSTAIKNKRPRRGGRAVAARANLWNEVKDRLDKPGAGLSGGQQQRLCIARAIAVEPQVLLMDEPCSALDPISTLAIEDLINELKDEFTIVIVTHNMQQAARVRDQTAFFNLAATGEPGRLVEMGDTQRSSTTPPRRRPRTTSPAASADRPRLGLGRGRRRSLPGGGVPSAAGCITTGCNR